MHGKTLLIGVLVLVTASGCKQKQEPAPQPTPPTQGAGTAQDAAATPAAPDELSITEGLATPESVLYDAAADRYIVSNINGQPTEADDNGYLAVVNPDGSMTKWIDGAKDDVKLDAPKGSAISDGTLWVADITVVRRFDARTGAQQGDIELEGVSFLNDVAPDGEGGIFVTDTGVDAKFQPAGTDAIYHVAKDGKVTTRIKDKALGNPNGIWPGANGSLWVVTFGSGEIYEVDAQGKQQPGHKLPKGQLDGIVVLDGGDVLVSSWEGKAVYRGKPGGEWKEIVSGIESPADFGWDPKRKRIVVPSFMGNTLTSAPVE